MSGAPTRNRSSAPSLESVGLTSTSHNHRYASFAPLHHPHPKLQQKEHTQGGTAAALRAPSSAKRFRENDAEDVDETWGSSYSAAGAAGTDEGRSSLGGAFYYPQQLPTPPTVTRSTAAGGRQRREGEGHNTLTSTPSSQLLSQLMEEAAGERGEGSAVRMDPLAAAGAGGAPDLMGTSLSQQLFPVTVKAAHRTAPTTPFLDDPPTARRGGVELREEYNYYSPGPSTPLWASQEVTLPDDTDDATGLQPPQRQTGGASPLSRADEEPLLAALEEESSLLGYLHRRGSRSTKHSASRASTGGGVPQSGSSPTTTTASRRSVLSQATWAAETAAFFKFIDARPLQTVSPAAKTQPRAEALADFSAPSSSPSSPAVARKVVATGKLPGLADDSREDDFTITVSRAHRH